MSDKNSPRAIAIISQYPVLAELDRELDRVVKEGHDKKNKYLAQIEELSKEVSGQVAGLKEKLVTQLRALNLLPPDYNEDIHNLVITVSGVIALVDKDAKEEEERVQVIKALRKAFKSTFGEDLN